MTKEEHDRYVAERLEQEAQRWASAKIDDAALARYRQHVVDMEAHRKLMPVERELLKVLDRATEIRKERR